MKELPTEDSPLATTADAGAGVVEATIVGRSAGEQLALLTTHGKRVDVRVRGRLWSELDLGDRVVLELDMKGRPHSIRRQTQSIAP